MKPKYKILRLQVTPIQTAEKQINDAADEGYVMKSSHSTVGHDGIVVIMELVEK